MEWEPVVGAAIGMGNSVKIFNGLKEEVMRQKSPKEVAELSEDQFRIYVRQMYRNTIKKWFDRLEQYKKESQITVDNYCKQKGWDCFKLDILQESGGNCRHCGMVDKYATIEADRMVTCWRCRK
jgi:hypothetical protein